MYYPKNIAAADVKITGIREILWHSFGPDTLSLEKREKSGVAGNNPEEWKDTILITKEKQLYIQPSYIFACIRDGAKYTKRGRGTLQVVVSATLQVLDKKILLDRYLPDEVTTCSERPVYLDIRGVKNPVTKARNIRYRICASPGWNTDFTIIWDKTLISKAEMHSIIIDAGMFSGLGDGRNIGFGRFEVKEFIIREDAEKKTS